MTCGKCSKRSNCKEICKEVEALLPKPRSGGHRKEITCDPQRMDKLYPEIPGVRERLGARKHKKIRYNDNWELD